MYKQSSLNFLAMYKSVLWSLPDTQQIQKVAVGGGSLVETHHGCLRSRALHSLRPSVPRINKARQGGVGHCQSRKEKVSPSPSVSARHWGSGPAWGTHQCHPRAQSKGSQPPSTASLPEPCGQGWQLAWGYTAIQNTGQRQLLLFLRSLSVQPLTDKSKKCVNFCRDLYFHYSLFNSSEQGHVVRWA